MKILILLVVVLIAIALPAFLFYLYHKRRHGLVASDSLSRNHLKLALWIDRIMHDDMVSPLIPKDDQENLTKLLNEYFGSSNRKALK